MDRKRFLGFVVFPAGIAAVLAFLFLVARVDIFRARTLDQSVAELSASPDAGVRAKAALDLMGRRDAAAAPALRAALADPASSVRASAAQALAHVAPAGAAADVAPLLDDKDADVRRVAAFLLGDLGDARALEPLRHALADPYEPVRWNAAVALARLGDGSGVAVLHDMLRAPVPRSLSGAVRTLVPGAPVAAPEPARLEHANALLALALVGGAESIRPIEAFVAADIEPDLEPVARAALERIRSR